MAGKRFHKNRFNGKKSNLSLKIILIREKKLIESNYEFLKCTIIQNKLVCKGTVKPTKHSVEYTIKIEYDGLNSPKVFVVKPEIEFNHDIHMYPDKKNLCLYHPETDNFYWTPKTHHIYDTIIPWTLEWFVYYELYLISGKWEHPFKPHRATKENTNDNAG